MFYLLIVRFSLMFLDSLMQNIFFFNNFRGIFTVCRVSFIKLYNESNISKFLERVHLCFKYQI